MNPDDLVRDVTTPSIVGRISQISSEGYATVVVGNDRDSTFRLSNSRRFRVVTALLKNLIPAPEAEWSPHNGMWKI